MTICVMIIDMREHMRDRMRLYDDRNDTLYLEKYCDLTDLLSITAENDLPLIVLTLNGVTNHLREVADHPVLKRAKILDKITMDAFENLAIRNYVASLGTTQLIVAGYNYVACVNETVYSAVRDGYKVFSAKTLLFGAHWQLKDSGKQVFESRFAYLGENTTDLIVRLGLIEPTNLQSPFSQQSASYQ